MVFVVLPAYNEEGNLPPLLASIRESLEGAGLPFEVIVVDDGSVDGTANAIREAGTRMTVRPVAHPVNRGLAETIRDGLLAAREIAAPDDVIVTMDADNTHPPALIPRMVGMIREGRDVVIASRYRPGSRVVGLSPSRRMLSYGASILFRLLFPIPGVRDYTCGYRAYRARVIGEMFDVYGQGFIDRPGFSCMVGILLKIRRHPFAAGEAPLVLRYDLKAGESKMKVGRTIRETLDLIVENLGRKHR